jgi:nicotinamidase-related amidase
MPIPPLHTSGLAVLSILAAISVSACSLHSKSADGRIQLRTRSRAPDGAGAAIKEETLSWDPQRTAFVIVDMWDDHWCKGAARRVVELAAPMDAVAKALRARGVLVVNAPSTTVEPYRDHPARKRAQEAPRIEPPVPLATSPRWGTAWCWPDPAREPALPIDDSDMGCDCEAKCEIKPPWTRQIDLIEIRPEDAITDDGQELVNLFAARGIDNVLIAGVHLNMCVLGRPVAIRQLRYLGKNVVLLRDLTDTMYNSKMPPKVDHFAGTDLVIEHVEKHWCPTATSADITGGPAFRFKEDARG